MAEPHVYGKSIVQPIRVFAGPDDPVAVHSLVSARLYPNPPSELQQQDFAETQGGFMEAVDAFSATDPTELTYTVTFAAVNDPDPQSGALYDYWHIVANVRLEAGAQPQSIYREVLLWRPTGQFSQLAVVPADIYAIETDIQKRLGDMKVLTKLALTKEDVFERLRDKDLDRSRIRERDLRMVMIWGTAALCLRDMATKENNYLEKAGYYEEKAETRWSSLKVGYADGENSAIEPTDKATTGVRGILVRI